MGLKRASALGAFSFEDRQTIGTEFVPMRAPSIMVSAVTNRTLVDSTSLHGARLGDPAASSNAGDVNKESKFQDENYRTDEKCV
jgi:hypothetical protein